MPTNSTNEEELNQEQDKTVYEEYYITTALYDPATLIHTWNLKTSKLK